MHTSPLLHINVVQIPVEITKILPVRMGTKIQLNVYGYPVTYGTMGTVLAAILAAFASRILLQEMNKVLN